MPSIARVSIYSKVHKTLKQRENIPSQNPLCYTHKSHQAIIQSENAYMKWISQCVLDMEKNTGISANNLITFFFAAWTLTLSKHENNKTMCESWLVLFSRSAVDWFTFKWIVILNLSQYVCYSFLIWTAPIRRIPDFFLHIFFSPSVSFISIVVWTLDIEHFFRAHISSMLFCGNR